jgi:hypothetical protein
MHHCAGTFTGGVADGACCFFSIRKDGARVATLQLVRGNEILPSAPGYDGVHIGQLRGPCNALVPKALERAVRAWLRAQKPRLPRPPQPAVRDDLFGDVLFQPDNFEIPF